MLELGGHENMTKKMGWDSWKIWRASWGWVIQKYARIVNNLVKDITLRIANREYSDFTYNQLELTLQILGWT